MYRTQLASYMNFIKSIPETVANYSFDTKDKRVVWSLKNNLSDYEVTRDTSLLDTEESLYKDLIINIAIYNEKGLIMSENLPIMDLPILTYKGFILNGNLRLPLIIMERGLGWDISEKTKDNYTLFFERKGRMSIKFIYSRNSTGTVLKVEILKEHKKVSLSVEEFFLEVLNISEEFINTYIPDFALFTKTLAPVKSNASLTESEKRYIRNMKINDNHFLRLENLCSFSNQLSGMTGRLTSEGHIISKNYLRDLDKNRESQIIVDDNIFINLMNTDKNLELEERRKQYSVENEYLTVLSIMMNFIKNKGFSYNMEQLSQKRIQTLGKLLDEWLNIRLDMIRRTLVRQFDTDQFVGREIRKFVKESLFRTKPCIDKLINESYTRLIVDINTMGVEVAWRTVYVNIKGKNTPSVLRELKEDQIGRLCLITTPEGEKAGLVLSLASGAIIDDGDTIKAPYYKVSHGQIDSSKVHYLSAQEEAYYNIAFFEKTIERDESYTLLDGSMCLGSKIDYIQIDIKHMFSSQAGYIPSLNTNDLKRLTMATGVLNQFVPLMNPDTLNLIDDTTKLNGKMWGVSCADIKQKMYLESANEDVLNYPIEIDSIERSGTQGKVYYKSLAPSDELEVMTSVFFTNNRGNSRNSTVSEYINPVLEKDEDIAIYPSDRSISKNNNILPAIGVKLITAFMTYKCYGQDDAIIISKEVYKNGLFKSLFSSTVTITLKTSYEYNNRKNPNSRNENMKTEVSREYGTKGRFKYLTEEGLPEIGTFIKKGQVIFNKVKVFINPVTEEEQAIENPISSNACGYVNSIKKVNVKDGVEYIIQLNIIKNLYDGDKFTGFYGNKGVTGRVISEMDMPYTSTGKRVQAIISPTSLIGRMNLGQILESVGWEISGDSENLDISKYTIVDYMAALEDNNIKGESLYLKGRKIKEKTLIGNLYFLKLEHLSDNKISYVGDPGNNRNMVTCQPREGKAHSGATTGSEAHHLATIGQGCSELYDISNTILSGDVLAYKQFNSELLNNPMDPDLSKIKLAGNEANLVNNYLISIGIGLFTDEDNKVQYMPLSVTDADNILEQNYSKIIKIENDLKPNPSVFTFNQDSMDKKNNFDYMTISDGFVYPSLLESEMFRSSILIRKIEMEKINPKKMDDYMYILINYDKSFHWFKKNGTYEKLPIKIGTDLNSYNLYGLYIGGHRSITLEILNNILLSKGILINNNGELLVITSERDIGAFNFKLEYAKESLSAEAEFLTKHSALKVMMYNHSFDRNINIISEELKECSSEVKFRELSNMLVKIKMAKNLLGDLKQYVHYRLLVLPEGMRPTITAKYDEKYNIVETSKDMAKYRDDFTSSYSYIFKHSQNRMSDIVLRDLYELYNIVLDSMKGKNHFIRGKVLKKRHTNSGRAAIIPGPNLKMDEVGIPISMFIQIFNGMIKGIVYNRIKTTLTLVEFEEEEYYIYTDPDTGKVIYRYKVSLLLSIIDSTLKDIINGNPVFENKTFIEQCIFDAIKIIEQTRYVGVNREPILWNGGSQAFKPVLVRGTSIKLNLTVCPVFNADFDGDQMQVYAYPFNVDLTGKLPEHNMYNMRDDSIIAIPDKDMVIGLYEFTRNYNTDKGLIIITDIEDLKRYLYNPNLPFSNEATLLFNGVKYTSTIARLYINYLAETLEKDGTLKYNAPITKSELSEIYLNLYNKHDNKSELIKIYDEFKKIGVFYCDIHTLSMDIFDLDIDRAFVKRRVDELKKHDLMYEELSKYWITMDSSTTSWSTLYKELKEEIYEALPLNHPFRIMVDSKARGSKDNIMFTFGFGGSVTLSNGVNSAPIKSGFLDGLSAADSLTLAKKVRRGQESTSDFTKLSGELGRNCKLLTSEIRLTEEDCGTDYSVYRLHYAAKLSSLDFVKGLSLNLSSLNVEPDKLDIIKSTLISGYQSVLEDEIDVNLAGDNITITESGTDENRFSDSIITVNTIKLFIHLGILNTIEVSYPTKSGRKFITINLPFKMEKYLRDLLVNRKAETEDSGLSSTMKNNKLTVESLDYIEQNKILTLKVRLLKDCKCLEGVCSTCAGDVSNKFLALNYMSNVHQVLNQFSLDSKNALTGGVMISFYKLYNSLMHGKTFSELQDKWKDNYLSRGISMVSEIYPNIELMNTEGGDSISLPYVEGIIRSKHELLLPGDSLFEEDIRDVLSLDSQQFHDLRLFKFIKFYTTIFEDERMIINSKILEVLYQSQALYGILELNLPSKINSNFTKILLDYNSEESPLVLNSLVRLDKQLPSLIFKKTPVIVGSELHIKKGDDLTLPLAAGYLKSSISRNMGRKGLTSPISDVARGKLFTRNITLKNIIPSRRMPALEEKIIVEDEQIIPVTEIQDNYEIISVKDERVETEDSEINNLNDFTTIFSK